MTLLLLSPPAFGAALGGALVRLVRIAFFHAATDQTGMTITLVIGTVASLVIGGICFRTCKVSQGAQTDFPKLLRAAPYTAALGIALGLTAAIAQANRAPR
jgi:hypothetical protein